MAQLALWQMSQFPKKSELTVETYQNAVILPLIKCPEDQLLFGRGGVVDEVGKYVPLSGIKDRIERQYDYENTQYKDDEVVYCGYFIKHWGHFLIETVARLCFF